MKRRSEDLSGNATIVGWIHNHRRDNKVRPRQHKLQEDNNFSSLLFLMSYFFGKKVQVDASFFFKKVPGLMGLAALTIVTTTHSCLLSDITAKTPVFSSFWLYKGHY